MRLLALKHGTGRVQSGINLVIFEGSNWMRKSDRVKKKKCQHLSSDPCIREQCNDHGCHGIKRRQIKMTGQRNMIEMEGFVEHEITHIMNFFLKRKNSHSLLLNCVERTILNSDIV